MKPYSTDVDIVALRPNILNLGRGSLAEYHDEAKSFIDRDLKIKWYRPAFDGFRSDTNIVSAHYFRQDNFDPDLFLYPAQLKRLSSYKTLQLIYQSFEKETTDDGFFDQYGRWKERYEDELLRVIQDGIDYDWNRDGSISDLEKNNRVFQARRLVRV